MYSLSECGIPQALVEISLEEEILSGNRIDGWTCIIRKLPQNALLFGDTNVIGGLEPPRASITSR